MEDIEMSDKQRMKQIEETGYKYLAIIQDNKIKTQVMKDENRVFEVSKKDSEIWIVCKKCVYEDKPVGFRCGNV